jgi:hypothetical protein
MIPRLLSVRKDRFPCLSQAGYPARHIRRHLASHTTLVEVGLSVSTAVWLARNCIGNTQGFCSTRSGMDPDRGLIQFGGAIDDWSKVSRDLFLNGYLESFLCLFESKTNMEAQRLAGRIPIYLLGLIYEDDRHLRILPL